ncbi:MAG: Lrp/AsnC family transcriptional regulator [Nitrososphaerales archaeon]
MTTKDTVKETNTLHAENITANSTTKLNIDDTDYTILKILSSNPRLSYRQLAKESHLAVKTVMQRIKKLTDRGVVKGFYVDIDHKKLGFRTTAIILVRLKGGLLRDEMPEAIKQFFVCGYYNVTGTTDTVIIAKFRDEEEMHDFAKALQKEQQLVLRTQSLVVLKTIKEDFKVVL